jgi:cobalt/nickel transport system permease protein
MHISDGIISTPITIMADAAALGLIYVTGRKATAEEIPRMGMTGAALFVISLIHFPVAGSSIHLGLFGLAGIILRNRAFPVVFTVLLFQSLIFQHGGLLAIGLNALNMGAGAYVAWMIWRIAVMPEYLRAVFAGLTGVLIPAMLMVFELRVTGYGASISLLLIVYLLTAFIEGGITLSAVLFLRKVKPEILNEEVMNDQQKNIEP